MRLHPISIALRYLKGQRTFHVAPFYGRPTFDNRQEAVARLRRLTGQDFGTDAKACGAWLRKNRWVYYSNPEERQKKLLASNVK